MKLVERLRDVIRPVASDQRSLRDVSGSRGPSVSAQGSAPQGGCASDAAEILGGEWRNVSGQRYLVVDRTYRASYRLGRVAVADCLPAEGGRWPRLGLLLTGTARIEVPEGRLLFFDLETTGLAGGAGTYAFLVGCGWFENAAFHVRQFVLTSFAAERPLLEEVEALLRGSAVLVTYNGKSFDAPLIDTRFLFHRLNAPCSELTHVDLLHPARRLWRGASGCQEGDAQAACRLSLMEANVLGHLRDGDVPGFEIPSRYFHFVRSGDACTLDGVLEHNRLDLLALAMLTARARQLLDEGAHAARTARESLGLGRLYERGGMVPEARACFGRALELEADVLTHAEALRAYAVLCRRQRRYSEAAEAWRRLLTMGGCPSRFEREAAEALAVHHEHRSRDLPAARQFAVRSLQFSASTPKERAVHHRLARLDRKLAMPASQSAPLF